MFLALIHIHIWILSIYYLYSTRINNDTNVLDDEEQKNSPKNKRSVDASPLSCFPKLMYDPKAPLFVFFIVELDLQEKVINQIQDDIEVLMKDFIEMEKEISNLKKMIKEKDFR